MQKDHRYVGNGSGAQCHRIGAGEYGDPRCARIATPLDRDAIEYCRGQDGAQKRWPTQAMNQPVSTTVVE